MSAELHDLAAGYALDALDELDQARFTRHLVECEPCQVAVSEFRATTVALAEAGSEPPPPELRERLLEQVAVTPQASADKAKPVAPSGRRRGLLAAAVVAVLALVGWSMFNPDRLIDRVLADPAALAFEAAATDAGAGRFEAARVVYSEEQGVAVLEVEGMTPLQADRTYEMWLVGESGASPAGTFEPAGDGEARVRINGEIAPGLVFAVTEEPAGGVDQPTGDILLSAELTA